MGGAASPDEETLCLRPLSGAEADVQVLHPRSNASRCGRRASICPTADRHRDPGRRPAAVRGAAAVAAARRRPVPLGRAASAFEPRAYQLVPLLMALRLPTVRLLIADDVGIGKTIEAGLILRELIDRGEVDRFAVLCPPHLVEQWTGELEAQVRSRRCRSHCLLGGAPGARPARRRRRCSMRIPTRSSASTTSRPTGVATALRAPAPSSSLSTRRMPASARIRAGSSASSCLKRLRR